ncbi:hypothetical protein PSEUBRA_003214 [Kalmanozyma brasiliensis GHG001]|uniref:Uncharacterized protein n=1 Tax=Kalmanozyma brasiliensis (strain GHG001) TaxID=1365824 RepID=V5EVT1_KALBG|nr:uncharacterized protein PSEUBRA_003214 [Kalmanozyma brasiliensis GHG001]EST07393.1 hypothetical protein PSEUBRA_003214 [Kalmanozyma brasiliensis GHG001]
MVRIVNKFRAFTVDEFHFPHEMKTNGDLIRFAKPLLCPKPSKAVEIYMILDIIQSVMTFALCMSVMFKKGRTKNFRIFTLRKSPHGTFIVPNAIVWLLGLVSIYLLAWAGFCSYILFVQETGRPLIEWLWYIPLPWLPLALGTFYAAYGFVLTCTPRSPISNLAPTNKASHLATKLSWIHLPLPQSAWVMNTFVLGVPSAMVVYNIVITALNGQQRALTHREGHDLYRQVLSKTHSQEWLDAAPTEELLYLTRVAWCDLGNVFRLCCAALASYMVLVLLVIAMVVFYSIPNQIYLMDHLVAIYPDDDFVQPTRRSLPNILRALCRIGLPRNLHGPAYSAFKRTWMMVLVGHTQMFCVLFGCSAFIVPVFYLYFVPWHRSLLGESADHEVTFIVAYCISAAFLTAGWVTAISGVLTFDDIFRAVSGLAGPQAEVTTKTQLVPEQLRGRRSLARGFKGASLSLTPGTPYSAVFASSASPSTPSFLTSPRGAASTLGPPSPAFTKEKDPSETLFEPHTHNTVLITTATVVRFEHQEQDVEAMQTDMFPYPPPAAASPFVFLTRTEK